MTTVKRLIERLKEDYKPTDVIAVAIWGADDVRLKMSDQDDMELNLTDDDINIILDDIDRHQDASLGITWDTIEYYVRDYKK